MTYCLPPNLLVFFAPRDPIKYVEHLDHLPWDTKAKPYAGVSQYISLFEDPKATPAPTRGETKTERQERRRQERQEVNKVKVEDRVGKWDPNGDSNAAGDAYKTLFVGRINYHTSEETLKKEFERYGPVKQIVMVKSTTNATKPRGYAFLEYEAERDMHSAYKHADGMKIDGQRVVVDVERGRTVKGWKPRSLGGGLGGTRKGAPHECIKYSGRVDENRSSGGDRERERPEKEREREREPPRGPDRDRDRGGRDRDRDYDRERRGDRYGGNRDRNDRGGDRNDRGGGGDRGYRGRDTRKDSYRDRERRRDRSRSRERRRY